MTITSDSQADQSLSVNHYDSSYSDQLQHDTTSDSITFSMSATPIISSMSPTTFDTPDTEIVIRGRGFGSLDASKLTLMSGGVEIKGGAITTAGGNDTWSVNVPCLPSGKYKFLHSLFFKEFLRNSI